MPIKKYTLINIYAPNKDNDIVNFFEKLRKTLQEGNVDTDEEVIVGGYFNCPMKPLLDKKGQELHASPHIEHTPILSYQYISIYGYVLSIYGYVG